ncbi:DNA-3-methyladenine glycosylase family protein [Chitinophaga defluvii]|uniref:DNA-3-methyladenine glycosylase II n=1 Tax=Chitinophaga defluvii TaxID=3163343 RepID=A0ABV2T029_9BACT
MITIPVSDYKHFTFAECLLFLGRSDKECMHYIQEGKLQRMIAIAEQPVLLEISEDPQKKALVAAATPVNGQPVDETVVRQYVSHWLHLQTDLGDFYRFAAKDPMLAPLTKQYRGLRLIGIPELFEALTWSIIGQQINLSFAYTLRQRFVQAFGYHTVIAGKDYYLYPHPAVVAALSPEQLIPMQFSRSKAVYIIETARQMAMGNLEERALQQMDYEAAREKLVSLKGIGNWSANYVLMKFSRFPQALPLEDAGLHNAIKKQLQLTIKPGLSDVKAYTAHWQQHAAYATFYLWRSLYGS